MESDGDEKQADDRLKPIHEDLQTANEQLLRANKELESFAGTASHDLQAPIRSLTQSTQIILNDYGENLDKDVIDLLNSMLRSMKRMKWLTDDLLHYAKIASNVPPDTTKVPAKEALADALENLEEDIRQTGALITNDPLPSDIIHSINLMRVFQNLIANALIYRGTEPPVVHVSARMDKKIWNFCVTDNGIGIDEKNYELIFEPFKRLHGTSIPGTGLGLALCRKIIEQLGGRIWVSSQLGAGSKFYFTIPT